MTGAVGSNSENTRGVENAGPRQSKEDQAAVKDSGGDAVLAETSRGVRSK